jgi:hypothetical protein
VATYINPGIGAWTMVINACNHGTCPGTKVGCYNFTTGATGATASGGAVWTTTCPTGYSLAIWADSAWSHSCASPNAKIFTGGVTLSSSIVVGVTGANDGWGGCQSAYSWAGGGSNHLCNDDGVYEMWQANNGNTGAGPINFTLNTNGFCEGSLCGGGSPAHYACTESMNNGGSGTWNTPNCF